MMPLSPKDRNFALLLLGWKSWAEVKKQTMQFETRAHLTSLVKQNFFEGKT